MVPIMSNIKKAFCLVFAVFVLYQDLNTAALALKNDKNFKQRAASSIVTPAIQMIREKYVEDVKALSQNIDLCDDWQIFDGEKCVCNNRCDAEGNGDENRVHVGKVCDITGQDYPNICEMSHKICTEELRPNVSELTSCGICQYLKFTGSQVLKGEDPEWGHGVFERNGNELEWTARDDKGNQYLLFYSVKADSWAVGVDKENIGILFRQQTKYPQDMKQGGFVLVKGEGGADDRMEQDPFLHFECIDDMPAVRAMRSENGTLIRPRKWFVFLIVCVVIAIAASATTYTLSKIQEANGCLYYPSLCRLKDEVKDMKVEVLQLDAKYKAFAGLGNDFQDLVFDIVDELRAMKTHLLGFKELDSDFDNLSEELSTDLKFMNVELEKDLNTKQYDEWIKGLKLQNTITLLMTMYIELPSEIYSVVVASTSVASLAFAAFGAVLSVITAVISIVMSIKAEKKQLDEIKRVHRGLLSARTDLRTALEHKKTLQPKIYEVIVIPLKKLSNDFQNFSLQFKLMYQYLVSVYGDSVDDTCEGDSCMLKRDTLYALYQGHLLALNYELAVNLNCLKTKIEIYKLLKEMVTIIKRNVNEKEFPDAIFRLVHIVHEDTADKVIPTQFSLMKFIANRVIENRNCYFGYDLNKIRSNSVTEANWKYQPLCYSSELDSIKANFQNLVNSNTDPQRFENLIQDEVFKTKYQKIKFMADFVLTNRNCYWGYPLELIRQNKIPSDNLIVAVIKLSTFKEIKKDYSNDIEGSICWLMDACDPDFQAYLACLINNYVDGDDMCSGSSTC